MMLNTEISKALERAEDALETAVHDLKGDFMLATVNRTYYCIYYCMTALLTSQEVYAKTHQGVRTKFSELFIKTGLLPKIMANYARDAFDIRQEADYDLDASVSEAEAQILIQNARDFYDITSKYLESLTKK
jgi:uncharacterized protein (UPF0332 family)